jgi:hypothetical protein
MSVSYRADRYFYCSLTNIVDAHLSSDISRHTATWTLPSSSLVSAAPPKCTAEKLVVCSLPLSSMRRKCESSPSNFRTHSDNCCRTVHPATLLDAPHHNSSTPNSSTPNRNVFADCSYAGKFLALHSKLMTYIVRQTRKMSPPQYTLSMHSFYYPTMEDII